jgi:hypothetical protein
LAYPNDALDNVLDDAKLNAAKAIVAERLLKQLEVCSEALDMDVINNAEVRDIQDAFTAWRELNQS